MSYKAAFAFVIWGVAMVFFVYLTDLFFCMCNWSTFGYDKPFFVPCVLFK